MVGLCAQIFHSPRRSFDQIPLIHCNDQRASLALDEVRDAEVLFLERILREKKNPYAKGKSRRSRVRAR